LGALPPCPSVIVNPRPTQASLFHRAKNVDTFPQCARIAANGFWKARGSPDIANVTSGMGGCA